MKVIIKFFRPLIIVMMRASWYVMRPKTSGSLVVLVHENKILLVKTTYGYDYGLPGGGIKKHETPIEAAIREVKEEVGIDIAEPQSLPSFITREEYKVDTVYGFYTTVTSPYFKLDALEIDSAEWHPINKLPKLGVASGKIVNLYLSQHSK